VKKMKKNRTESSIRAFELQFIYCMYGQWEIFRVCVFEAG